MGSVRYVFRRLSRSPLFTTVALLTLALSIGANTAIFSVVEGVLLRPLPFLRAEQLVSIWHAAPGAPGLVGNLNCSPTMYFTYREQARSFQGVGLWQRDGVAVNGAGDPEHVVALDVTYGVLQLLGVPPARGRWFTEADDAPGSPETVILTDGYWQRKFNRDPAVIGRTLV